MLWSAPEQSPDLLMGEVPWDPFRWLSGRCRPSGRHRAWRFNWSLPSGLLNHHWAPGNWGYGSNLSNWCWRVIGSSHCRVAYRSCFSLLYTRIVGCFDCVSVASFCANSLWYPPTVVARLCFGNEAGRLHCAKHYIVLTKPTGVTMSVWNNDAKFGLWLTFAV